MVVCRTNIPASIFRKIAPIDVPGFSANVTDTCKEFSPRENLKDNIGDSREF
jgi:hypothetical protein